MNYGKIPRRFPGGFGHLHKILLLKMPVTMISKVDPSKGWLFTFEKFTQNDQASSTEWMDCVGTSLCAIKLCIAKDKQSTRDVLP